jgi:hypothetical protein
MAFPMNSILEELRCMDGELFRSELTQRLYLLLKVQVHDALASTTRSAAQTRQFHAKILEWPAAVRDEELSLLRSKSSEIEGLFVQVAMLYVKLSHKSTENRIVKISRPRIEDLLRGFYQAILHNPWGSSGELWTFDPIKLDFVLRECFRKAIMESVQVVQSQAPPPALSRRDDRRDDDTEIGPDDSISNFLGPPLEPTFSQPNRNLDRVSNDNRTSIDNRTSTDNRTNGNRSSDDGSTQSRSTRSSSSRSDDHRSNENRGDDEYVRESSRDANTVVGSRRDDDSRTVRRDAEDDGRTVHRDAEDDTRTVRRDTRNDAGTVVADRAPSDARTVTFQLPRGAGSVVSSVSDTSNGSRYMTAMMHKPTLLPVSEMETQAQPSLRIEFHGEDDEASEDSD